MTISYEEAYKELVLAVIENRRANVPDDIDDAGVFAAAHCRLSQLYWQTDKEKHYKLMEVCRFDTFPRSNICLFHDSEVSAGKNKVNMRKFIDVIEALQDDNVFSQSVIESVVPSKRQVQ